MEMDFWEVDSKKVIEEKVVPCDIFKDDVKVPFIVLKQSTIDEYGFDEIKERNIYDWRCDLGVDDLKEDGKLHIIFNDISE